MVDAGGGLLGIRAGNPIAASLVRRGRLFESAALRGVAADKLARWAARVRGIGETARTADGRKWCGSRQVDHTARLSGQVAMRRRVPWTCNPGPDREWTCDTGGGRARTARFWRESGSSRCRSCSGSVCNARCVVWTILIAGSQRGRRIAQNSNRLNQTAETAVEVKLGSVKERGNRGTGVGKERTPGRDGVGSEAAVELLGLRDRKSVV